jgi:hypothetical protein
MEKDAAVQKSIAAREEKIQQLKEKSLKKEDDLSTKSKELMELRERTRRMMEKARAKEAEFKENEKQLERVLNQDPTAKQSMMDKILAKASQKAEQLRAEKREARRRQEEAAAAGGGDEDNLLAFLRRSHKEGRNIYDFLDPGAEKGTDIVPHVKPTISDSHEVPVNELGTSVDVSTSKINSKARSTGGLSSQNGWKEEQRGLNSTVINFTHKKDSAVCDIGQMEQEPLNKIRGKQEGGGQSLSNKFITMYKDFSDSVHNLTSPKQSRHVAETSAAEKKIADSEGTLTFNGSCEKWAAVEVEREEEALPSFCSPENYVHYAERWSLSPPQERQSRMNTASPTPRPPAPPPASKLRPLNKPAIIVNGRLRTKDYSSEVRERKKKESNGAASPPYGALVRRKSLSDNCLTAKSQQQRVRSQTMERELDAFGIPRLPPRPRRSVSLMRETFVNRGREEPQQQQHHNALKQRAISHETRTSSAAEFKSLFEAGSAGNSTRASRATTPFRPPQVSTVWSWMDNALMVSLNSTWDLKG